MVRNEKLVVSIHERAKVIVKTLGKNESDLIEILEEVVRHKVYRAYNYPNFFIYLTMSHGLSESRAKEFSSVVSAVMKFDRLKMALASGKISLSKARRIAPVLEERNQEEWISKAQKNNHRALEKHVTGKNPESNFYESYRFISANRLEVKIIMTQTEFESFKRAQDLLCQKRKLPVSLRGTINHLTSEFMRSEDPVQKALAYQEKELKKTLKKKLADERQKEKKAKAEDDGVETQMNSATQEVADFGTCQNHVNALIPLAIFHQVYLRDNGQCQEILPNGEKCGDSRWIDIHHLKPVGHGGTNSLDNLQTLCKGHHRLEHWMH